jgi:hypothetical protein
LLAAALGPLTCIGGCAGASREDAGHVVVDSAGVRIVTSRRPLWAADEGWRVDSVTSLASGADDADSLAMLQVVAGAMRSSDGSLLVADRGGSQLKYFDRSG